MKKKTIQIFSGRKLLDGLEIKTVKAGIKSKTRKDVTLIIFKEFANVAVALTKSKTSAPNINWIKKIRNYGKAKAVFINSGNANAYTGKKGYQNVLKIVQSLAKIYNCKEESILVSSTGVIGEQLPIKKIINSLSILADTNYKNNQSWLSFAKAIMTTDTFPKGYYKKISLNKKKYNIVGVCKGSGMIAPNMATMLAFIFTDVELSSAQLSKMLSSSIDRSFNNITVDGDTSTNDMVGLFSIKKRKTNLAASLDKKSLNKFQKYLDEVAIELAKQIVVDGEGAKKLVEIVIKGAKNDSQAKNIAFSIANSLLVKTAIAGEDANWGRIIMAIGKSSATVNQNKISLHIGNHLIINKGEVCDSYSEKELTRYLKKKEIIITVNMLLGNGVSKVWTCDLTKRYIDINADYRS